MVEKGNLVIELAHIRRSVISVARVRREMVTADVFTRRYFSQDGR
jgi:hypothetical protein